MPKNKKKDIEVISGEINDNILLIAPHGVKGDDDNTGKLAKAIQKKLKCHAIINEVFKKPEKEADDKYGDANIEDLKADLNHRPHAEAHPTFIKEITDKIHDPNNSYVFWIHGIDDDNLAEEADKRNYGEAKCLVGYGQGKDNNKSMEEEKAKSFIKLLNNNGLLTKQIHSQSPKYRGASPTNMNQYFKAIGDNALADVESVQLEFANEGIRDEKKNTNITGIQVAKAISELVGCETFGIAEKEADNDLVKEATEKVMDFIETNHKNSIEVGHYLIEQFYGNDYAKAKKGNAVKGKSLHAMMDELQKKPDAPSKSWFYNAVNLAVDDKEYEGDEDYKKLNLSHKINLTRLNTKDEYKTAKLGLIKEIANDGMLIKDLLVRIDKIKAKPEKVWPSADEIAAMDDEKKMKQKNKAEQRKKTLQNAIESLKKKLAEQEAELNKMEQIIAAVEQTSGQTNEQAEEDEGLKKAA